MNSPTTQSLPVLPRKISLQAQQSVNELLEVVADQGRRLSLSGADYRIHKRLERMASQSEMDSEESFDDLSSYTTSSDFSSSSYSPLPTQERISWDISPHNVINKDLSREGMGCKSPRLPPLDPVKLKRPSRPPPRSPPQEALTRDEHIKLKHPPRPSSARGPRTVPRTRNITA